MRCTVTYVHHNCFCLAMGGRVLVFDYPDAAHRSPDAEGIVRDAVRGRQACVFFSHSHADHCSPDVAAPLAAAASVRHVLSYDVPEMVEAFSPQVLPGAAVVEPGDDPRGGVPGPTVEVDAAVTASGLESNDLGVAFLIDVEGLRVYFGGDLAEWLWPGMDEASAAFTREFFARSLDAVRAFAPHVAFMDCDRRLPQWGGFEAFARAVRPRWLVPMHDFGEPEVVRDYASRLEVEGVRIVTYGRPGERMELELPG